MGCCGSKPDMVPFAPEPYVFKPSSMQQPSAMAQRPMSPFMRSTSPSGLPWFQYVATAPIEVDPYSGLLAGPWAECLSAAVAFEHSCHWQSMPEYACGAEGPAGGVLAALELALGGPRSSFAQETLAAASRLEDAMHQAAEQGRPMPVVAGSVAPAWGAPPPSAPYAQHSYSDYTTQYGHANPHYGGPHYGEPQFGGPQFGHEPQPYAGGPTLLESQPQRQGMSTGGKMAMAAAGGVAAGVAGYALATHLDDVGDALGGAVEGVGHFAGEAFEGIGGAMEGVGHFAGEAFEEVGGFVEDLF